MLLSKGVYLSLIGDNGQILPPQPVTVIQKLKPLALCAQGFIFFVLFLKIALRK
jgi:hypothetical protein